MSTASSLTFGDYDSTVADKIVNQLIKDSEDLTTSLQGFINTRGKIVQSQKLALATYDEEIAAINDSEADDNFMF